jgi:tRNA-guanine family transglycosylase
MCTRAIPKDKPIYLMGVGYPEDMMVCVALGVDMFDCVYPCRTARFGSALTRAGHLRLKNSQFELDFRPIEDHCQCDTCKHYSRAFLHMLVDKEELFCSLVTTHNLHFELQLMRDCRQAIMEGTL